MNEKRTPRRASNEEAKKFTRECLLGALLRLVKKKPFDKISVSELVECAGVSRTAFYRNYSTIDDIIKIPVLEILSVVKASLSDEKYRSRPLLWYSDLISYLINYKEVLEALLISSGGHFTEISGLNDMFCPINDGERGEYELEIFKSSLQAILVKWILDGFTSDASLVASICVDTQMSCNIKMK